MIFTLAGNRRRIEDAAVKAREEGREEIRQQMADWYQSAKEEMAAGYEPDPPPIFGEAGGGSQSD